MLCWDGRTVIAFHIFVALSIKDSLLNRLLSQPLWLPAWPPCSPVSCLVNIQLEKPDRSELHREASGCGWPHVNRGGCPGPLDGLL